MLLSGRIFHWLRYTPFSIRLSPSSEGDTKHYHRNHNNHDHHHVHVSSRCQCKSHQSADRHRPNLSIHTALNVRHYSQSIPIITDIKRHIPAHILKPPYALSDAPIIKPQEIEIKTNLVIEKLRKACKVARTILDATAQHVKVGVSTDELDEIVHNLCISHNVYPSPLGYHGYPRSVCTSVNNVVCHGIPNDERLKDGDIINVDVTVFCDGYHGDVSETYTVGDVSPVMTRLVDAAKRCRDETVAICGPGARFCDIGNTISGIAEAAGFSVVGAFCGHGIGTFFHGPPDIIHIAHEDTETMEEGMTFTIEPVISAGSPDIKILDDGWTAVSLDGSWSAQFEHTVAVTRDGVEVLTESV